MSLFINLDRSICTTASLSLQRVADRATPSTSIYQSPIPHPRTVAFPDSSALRPSRRSPAGEHAELPKSGAVVPAGQGMPAETPPGQ